MRPIPVRSFLNITAPIMRWTMASGSLPPVRWAPGGSAMCGPRVWNRYRVSTGRTGRNSSMSTRRRRRRCMKAISRDMKKPRWTGAGWPWRMTRTGRIWPGAMTSTLCSTGGSDCLTGITGSIPGTVTTGIWSMMEGIRDGIREAPVPRRKAAGRRVAVRAADMRVGVWVLMGSLRLDRCRWVGSRRGQVCRRILREDGDSVRGMSGIPAWWSLRRTGLVGRGFRVVLRGVSVGYTDCRRAGAR